jgi:hypothetical protein
MKSILVIFAVLGMAAQTHAQTYTCADTYWVDLGYLSQEGLCSNGNTPISDSTPLTTDDVSSGDDFLVLCCLYSCQSDGVDTNGYSCPATTNFIDSQYFENTEENFQQNCCFTDCAAVQGDYTCPNPETQTIHSDPINYGLVTDQLSFEDSCCVTSCSQHSMDCSAGLQVIADAVTGLPDDSGQDQASFNSDCCEIIPEQPCVGSTETCSVGTKTVNDVLTYTDNFQDNCCELTCAEFQTKYNAADPANDLQCTNTEQITISDSYIISSGDFNVPIYAANSLRSFIIYSDYNGNDFNNLCCTACRIGEIKVVTSNDGFSGDVSFLIYGENNVEDDSFAIIGYGNAIYCSAITTDELPFIKQATDAAGALLTSTCEVAQP